MNTWAYVRLGLVLFTAVASCFDSLGPQADPPMGWGSLAIVFVFSPFALVIVLGIQAANGRSASAWHRPTWSLNPFNFRDPIQFFHLGAYVAISQGIVTVARFAISPVSIYPEAFVPLAMGIGILIGIQIAIALFRSKMERSA